MEKQSTGKQFEWVPFYQALSEKLLAVVGARLFLWHGKVGGLPGRKITFTYLIFAIYMLL